MKALVTGGGGFLGRYIVKNLLAKNIEVRILGRSLHQDLVDAGVEQISADIRDADKVQEACRGMDCVFHTAALAGIWGDPKVFESINITGTRNILKSCLDEGVSYLVHTSSPSVVFDGKDQVMLNEQTPYPKNYLCDYPRTKAISEAEVLAENKNGKLETVALRPHLIWGLGDNHLIPRLIDRARAGKLRIVGEGNNDVDMVHVQNAADAHILALDALKEGRAAGEAYFITNGEPVRLWPWINDLLGSLSIPKVEKRISWSAATKVGSIFEWFYKTFGIQSEPRMTRFLAAQLATHHTYSIDKAQRDLNYDPKVSMEAGLQELIKSYK